MQEKDMKQPSQMSGDDMIKYLSEFNISNEDTHQEGTHFHTHQQFQAEPFHVEKSWGVYTDPEGTFKDNKTIQHEVDFKNDEHESIGMPSDALHCTPDSNY